MSTICAPIKNVEELFNPSIVKVIANRRGFAIYFSRAPIPWERENFTDSKKTMKASHFRHIGLYSYRVGYLSEYMQIPPSEVELAENLEQLRILMNGQRIHLSITENEIPPGVDTEEDLEVIKQLFSAKKKA